MLANPRSGFEGTGGEIDIMSKFQLDLHSSNPVAKIITGVLILVFDCEHPTWARCNYFRK